jgi:aminopeptidase C
MDANLMDYETAFNIKLGLSKAQRLQSGESLMTHAMVITAVHLDADGKPVRFKVENSWGTEPGEKGWFMCTAAWFDECVCPVACVRRALAERALGSSSRSSCRSRLRPRASSRCSRARSASRSHLGTPWYDPAARPASDHN